LIFEVTGGRILSFPIKNQQSSLNSRQFFPLIAIPGSVQKSAAPCFALRGKLVDLVNLEGNLLP